MCGAQLIAVVARQIRKAIFASRKSQFVAVFALVTLLAAPLGGLVLISAIQTINLGREACLGEVARSSRIHSVVRRLQRTKVTRHAGLAGLKV